MEFLYLGAILFSFLGMLVLDYRFNLAFFHRAKRTAVTLLVGLVIFIIWDIFGIVMGIFFEGKSQFVTGIMLAPHFPLEELFFLTFLCYFALIVYRLMERLWPRT